MIKALFARRWRSFRVIDIVGLGVLLTLILILYLAKTFAGDERSQIARVENQIAEEKARVRVLRAEVAYLEQPERIERLARDYLGMEPIGAAHEAPAAELPEIAEEGEKP